MWGFHKSQGWICSSALALCYPYTDREAPFAFKYNQWMMAKFREREGNRCAAGADYWVTSGLVTVSRAWRGPGAEVRSGSLGGVWRSGEGGEIMCQQSERAGRVISGIQTRRSGPGLAVFTWSLYGQGMVTGPARMLMRADPGHSSEPSLQRSGPRLHMARVTPDGCRTPQPWSLCPELLARKMDKNDFTADSNRSWIPSSRM